MIGVFVLFILAFRALDNPSVIDAIYTIAGYTYGPLLGLFVFGMFTKRIPSVRLLPVVAVVSPVVCYLTDVLTLRLTGYKFGYEMLMLNGLLTFIGLWIFSRRGKEDLPMSKQFNA